MHKILRVVAFMMLLFIMACSKGPKHNYDEIVDADKVVDGGVLIEATAGDASKLNPVVHGDSVSGSLCDLIFSSLVRYSPKLVLEGELAESWKFSDGGKTLTFKIKKGVLWQDGQPLTSADVAFTWKSIMDPKVASPRKGDFSLVTSVETPDPLTVVVRYSKAYAPALESWGQKLIPKHLLEGQNLNEAPFNRKPVGSGAYRFVEWKDKQFVSLEANPTYFEGKPHISRYVLRFVPNASTKLFELKSEGIDQTDLSPDQFSRETDDKRFKSVARKFQYPGLSNYSYMGFNLARPPFNDKRVRKALSMAIDRQSLIDGVLQGLGRPCTGPYSPLMEAYDPAVKPVAFDLIKAGRLLDQAGYKLAKSGLREKDGKPLKFKLITNEGNETRKKIVVILQQQFAKLGVQAEVQTFEWSTFMSNYIDKKDFDVCVLGWQLSLDPDQFTIWHSSQTSPGQFNFLDYKSPQADALLEKGRITMDWAERVKIYRAFHRLLAEDEPVAFLYSPDSLSALNRKVQGLMLTDSGYAWYWTQRWYIPASLQN